MYVLLLSLVEQAATPPLKVEVVPQADVWFKAYVLATFAIALFSAGTLLVISLQRKAMSEQLAEMKSAGKQTQDLIAQAKDQVAALTKSAEAAQTMARSVEKQLTIMKDAALSADITAEFTRDAAIAGKKSADALVASERAWIMVKVDKVPGHGGVFHGAGVGPGTPITQSTGAPIRITCKNEGKTPAWITEILACLDVVDSLPDVPDFKYAQMVQNEPE